MTIKLKAPVIWLDEADLRGFLSKRLTERERRYRIVSESDWRKLMKLVKAVECPDTNTSVRDALAALEKKK